MGETKRSLCGHACVTVYPLYAFDKRDYKCLPFQAIGRLEISSLSLFLLSSLIEQEKRHVWRGMIIHQIRETEEMCACLDPEMSSINGHADAFTSSQWYNYANS